METIGGLCAMGAFVCVFGFFSAIFRKKPKRGWAIGFVGCFLLACFISNAAPQTTAASSATAAPTAEPVADTHADQSEQSDASTATDAPAATDPPAPPTLSPKEQKKEFLETVDESISGKRIAGNPAKFVGDNVDLHGKVLNVLDEHTFNFQAGDVKIDDDGNVSDTEGIIVVQCASTSDLEADEKIRVIGTVVESTPGTNAMGGQMNFPTVKAEFME